MDWRERLLTTFGPGTLGGISAGSWFQLLRREGFDWVRFPRVLSITLQSLKNSLFHAYERRHFGPLVEGVRVEPPVFVLGHWRSGTTHLHNLLAQDRRFAFPNGYQVTFPHTFLTTETMDSRWLSRFLPKHRPMDNVELTLASPQEDEFALCAASLKSPCMGWVFPRRREHFGRYLTFREAPEEEIAEWSAALEGFLKKLTWKHRRPLILKSPPHTCRIRLLLRMFPGAKFVHIHRDPRVVFQSSRRMFQKIFPWQQLQRSDPGDLDDWILRQYREMYQAFFEERTLIPAGSYHEMAFEALEKDPLGEVRRAYEVLGLPDFQGAEADVRRYIAGLRGYEKNRFPELPDGLRRRIDSMWEPTIREWGYGG